MDLNNENKGKALNPVAPYSIRLKIVVIIEKIAIKNTMNKRTKIPKGK